MDNLYKEMIKGFVKQIFDALNKFLLFVDIVLIVISFFVKNFYIDLVKYLLLVVIVFRMFSKDRGKRSKENKTFLAIVNFFLKPFVGIKRNFKERKFNVYKKCFKCKTILKLPLPKKRGILHAKCPNCGNRVTIFCLRKEKVEIIKIKKKR